MRPAKRCDLDLVSFSRLLSLNNQNCNDTDLAPGRRADETQGSAFHRRAAFVRAPGIHAESASKKGADGLVGLSALHWSRCSRRTPTAANHRIRTLRRCDPQLDFGPIILGPQPSEQGSGVPISWRFATVLTLDNPKHRAQRCINSPSHQS